MMVAYDCLDNAVQAQKNQNMIGETKSYLTQQSKSASHTINTRFYIISFTHSDKMKEVYH